jgi:predicted enzyme related to lactoylglutathione lyase
MAVTPRLRTISWQDLTVEHAEQVRDFYQAVTGWKPEPLSMGGYSDFVMADEDGAGVAGICHARGQNVELPPVWLIYITVGDGDLDHSIAEVQRLGGSLVAAPRSYGGGRYCVIKDPAGAVCALYQPPDAG